MTPMQHVFRIHEDDVLDFRLMRRIADSGHSRIPVMRTPATAPPAAELDAHAAELDAHAAPAAAPAQPSLGAGSDAEGGAEGGAKGGEEASDCGAGAAAGAAAGAWPSTARSDELVGLLSAKDLILIDPEDGVPIGTDASGCCVVVSATRPRHVRDMPASGTMLEYCGRAVVTVWFDTPVAQLFRDFKREIARDCARWREVTRDQLFRDFNRGQPHLAVVQDPSLTLPGPFPQARPVAHRDGPARQRRGRVPRPLLRDRRRDMAEREPRL